MLYSLLVTFHLALCAGIVGLVLLSLAGRDRGTRALALVLPVSVAVAAQALTFPSLGGRVVDEAGLLTAQDEADIAASLQALEDKQG